MAPRLSPGTRRIPSSSPEWHPDCHLERSGFSPRPALPTLGTWPALGIPLAPSSATSLAPGAETHKTPCPALPSSMAPGRSQSCPLQVGFGQTSRIGLSHTDCYYANDCFNLTPFYFLNVVLLPSLILLALPKPFQLPTATEMILALPQHIYCEYANCQRMDSKKCPSVSG